LGQGRTRGGVGRKWGKGKIARGGHGRGKRQGVVWEKGGKNRSSGGIRT